MICLCADDNFAMPLATTLASVASNFSWNRPLTVLIVDAGISADNRRKIEETMADRPATFRWRSPDELDADLPTIERLPSVTYHRLSVPRWFPEIRRAIYLDCDAVVLGDLEELWCKDCGENILLAAEDGGRTVGDKFGAEQCGHLGIDKDSRYFNAGLMLIDFDRYREFDVESKAIRFAKEHSELIKCADQCALNGVLTGKWGVLNPAWNHTRFDDRFRIRTFFANIGLLQNPLPDIKFLHFVTQMKPWRLGCYHPYRQLFFAYLDLTEWKGWRHPAWRDRLARWSRHANETRRLRLPWIKSLLTTAARRLIPGSERRDWPRYPI